MLNINISAGEIAKKLSTIDLKSVNSNWIKRGTATLQGQARIESPIDTGNLRNLIQFEARDDIGYVRSLAPYSIFVHEGTKYIKSPNQFMTRAKESTMNEIIQDYQNLLQQHISKLGLNN